MLFNFALQYAIRRVQVNQDGLKLNGTYQLLVYADHANILGGSVHTIKENAEVLAVASKKTGTEVNVDKTKCMVTSQDQNAGQSHNTKIYYSSFERVKQFEYLRTNLTHQNFNQEAIQNRLKSGNACYHSVQNLSTSSLLSKIKDDDIQNNNFACSFVQV